MSNWLNALSVNPLPALLASDDPALAYFVRRDLLGEEVPPIETLWVLPQAERLVRGQLPDGSWRYPGGQSESKIGTNYDLLESYRIVRLLVEMYGLQSRHAAIERAVGYFFACQTEDGDIRGILGNQYMPYYHGAILELLVKAGFGADPRLERGLAWLLAMRQDDGGWVIPAQLVPAARKTRDFWQGAPLLPEWSRPHAHLATGMVLRAFAAHPAYRHNPEIIAAAGCLKSRLFQPDKYGDRKASSYWLKFQYPFWWTSLLTGLDTLSRLGFRPADQDVARGLSWFLVNQVFDGLWETGYDKGKGAAAMRRWVGLAVCRVIKTLLS